MSFQRVVDESKLAWEGKRQIAKSSELDLTPGKWPELVRVQLRAQGGQPAGERDFRLKTIKRSGEGTLIHIDYETTGGRRLRIVNDGTKEDIQ